MFLKTALSTGLAIVSLIPLSTAAFAQEPRQDLGAVNVSGEASVMAVPDIVRISLTSQSRGADRKAAAQEVRDISAKVREAVLGAGVEPKQIQTQRLSLYPIYEQLDTDRVPRLVGYSASTGISVTVEDAGIAADALDAGVDAGATGVDGPHFEVSDPDAYRLDALGDAMRKAKQKAEVLAEAGGFSLGEVVSVHEQTVSSGPVYPMMMMKAASAETASTQIDVGQTEIMATVTVSYSVLPSDM